MALLDKNGKIYTLSRPNPIMTDQELWVQKEKLIFHNKIGKSVVLLDEARPVERITDFAFDAKVLAQTQEMLGKQEPEIVTSLEEPEVGGAEDEKMQVWCLPASYKEYKDNLYGEKYRKVRYGNKFLAEAIILEQEDLFMTMWTNTKAVTEGSILFPRTHDKRWWRAERIKEQDGGYIIYSMISDYQPKFSD